MDISSIVQLGVSNLDRGSSKIIDVKKSFLELLTNEKEQLEVLLMDSKEKDVSKEKQVPEQMLCFMVGLEPIQTAWNEVPLEEEESKLQCITSESSSCVTDIAVGEKVQQKDSLRFEEMDVETQIFDMVQTTPVKLQKNYEDLGESTTIEGASALDCEETQDRGVEEIPILEGKRQKANQTTNREEKTLEVSPQNTEVENVEVQYIQEEPITEVLEIHVETPKELPKKVMEILQQKIATKQRVVEIQLRPKELGEITLKAAYHENQTTIEIHCTNAKTLELIVGSTKAMEEILEVNLGKPTQVVIQKEVQDYLNQQQQEKQQDHNQSNSQQKQRYYVPNKEADETEDFIQQLRLGLTNTAFK